MGNRFSALKEFQIGSPFSVNCVVHMSCTCGVCTDECVVLRA